MQRVLVPEGMLYLSLLEEQDETWEEESRCAGSEHFFARNTSEESEALLRAVYTRLQTDGKRSYFPEEPDESGRMGSQNATWDSFYAEPERVLESDMPLPMTLPGVRCIISLRRL
jgi:hypothetical protein